MIQTIETIEDVKDFFRQLLSEGLNFHPDTPFEDYINGETRLDTYSLEEAKLRNELLDECFTVCDKFNADIYEIANEVFKYFD